ncbi:MAG: hypothetical protein U5K79_21910 [Cyclobacteriaceae bacterium]|nr:hypothetical protein [Cyclobacteriaceae bacterium]
MKYYTIATIVLLVFLPACHKKTILEQELEMQQQNLLLWEFPLPRTHTGALLGNGVQGLMVWGADNKLNITIGRAGFWDRRGGNKALSKITYHQLKDMLYGGNEEAIKAAFGIPEVAEPGQPTRPHQIGGGRLEIELPDGWELKRGVLDLNNGIFEVTIRNTNDEIKGNKYQAICIRRACRSLAAGGNNGSGKHSLGTFLGTCEGTIRESQCSAA